MSVGKIARGGLIGVILRWAGGLRFPYLFLLTAALFVINLFVPDALPMADELIMGLLAALLASLKKRRGDADQPASTDGTPPPSDAPDRRD